jgi:uncharacterized protein
VRRSRRGAARDRIRGVPREVVLLLPPSPEPPATDGPALLVAAAGALGCAPDALAAARLRRLSFDARPRARHWRLVLDVWERGEAVPPPAPTTPPTFAAPPPGAPNVVIVGSGPAGMFCALDCLAAGLAVTVLERGRDVQARRHALAAVNRGQPIDPDSNYCFGEGGAGTYSDGKLYTRSGSRAAVRAVLETLVAHGAPLEILASWRPHVGSNRLPRVVQALRETLERSAGRVRFGARVEEIETARRDGRRAVVAAVARDLDSGTIERVPCDALVLATGHSALDALEMASRAGAALEPKGFAMGVRIEHPQPWLDARQYGGLRDACDLPAAFYELATQVDGCGVYSFCMCPGGFVVPASTDASRVVVNGMSLSRRDSPFANGGLVVQLEPEDWCGARGAGWGWTALIGEPLPDRPAEDPLFGVRLQLALERKAAAMAGGANRAPSQRADLFVEERGRLAEPEPSSYRPGLVAVDLGELLPRGLRSRLQTALRVFERKLPGFAGPGGQVIGVETRTSSPVRIARDPETMESREVGGLYPSGEGAGYAGGIVSAALDGRRAAVGIVTRLRCAGRRMLPRPWTPILFGLILLSACRGGDESAHDRERARLDTVEQRLGTLEQRLAAIDKDLPTGERLRDDLHALEQRVGAVESKATEALETAKSAPTAAPRRKGDVAPAPPRPAPAERRAQLAALMTEYRRRLADVRRQESPGASPADQMAARRAVRDWYIARRRAIIGGQPLPD